MSKLTFRARALDCIKRLSLYRKEQLPDLAEYAANQRSVPAMPSGMEKEEEMELHLQQVISARQSASKPVQAFDVSIPIPRVETERNRYEALYRTDFVQPKRFVAVQSSNTDLMDYDMDSDDEAWFQTFVKKFELKQGVFDQIMGSLEKRSHYNMVITLEEARTLFNGPSDFVDELYRYWLNKRKSGITLIPQVLTDNRDASPMAYIAFRRRKEKIATRKWRKTEQDTVIRGMVVAQSIDRASTGVIEALIQRDSSLSSLVFGDAEFVRSCYYNGEWNIGDIPLFKWEPHPPVLLAKKQQSEVCQRRRSKKPAVFKAEMEKSVATTRTLASTRRKAQSSLRIAENNQVDQVDISNPDGRFTFRRRKNCIYYLPASGSSSGISTCSREIFYPVHLRSHLLYDDSNLRFAGFCRRRRSRGGRVVFDRLLDSFEDRTEGTDGEFDVESRGTGYRPQSLISDSQGDFDVCDLNFLIDSGRKEVDVIKCSQSARDWNFSVQFGIHLPAELDDASSVIGVRINTLLRKRPGNTYFPEPQKKKSCYLTHLDAQMSQLAAQAVEQPAESTVCFSNEESLAHVYPDADSGRPDTLHTSQLALLQAPNSSVGEALLECAPSLKRQTVDGSCPIAVDHVHKLPSYYASSEKCHCPPESSFGPPSTTATSVNTGGAYRTTTASSVQNVTTFKNVVSVDHGNYVSVSPVADRDVHPVLVNGATSSVIMPQQNGNGSFSSMGSVDTDTVVYKPSQNECCSTSITPYRLDCSPFGCMAGSAWNATYAGEMETLSIDDFMAGSRLAEPERNMSSERLNLVRRRKALLTAGDIKGYSPFMFRKLNKSENTPKGASRSAVRGLEYRWPDGEVPYVLSRTYYSKDRQLIARAMDEFQKKTCIRFVPRDPRRHYDYVYVEPDDGCYSMIGRMGGSQPLSLTDDCMEFGIILHELMHAVGFIHEHSRTDRDQYVRIIWRNIIRGTESEFEKYSSSEVDNNGFSYDYGSIMHYDNLAFSRNGRPTIEAKQKPKEGVMGQRDGFSSLDMQKINKLYDCSSNFQTAGPYEESSGNIFGQGTMEPFSALCVDFNGHCKSWAAAGYCRLSSYQIYMAATCPVACGLC
ncbi:hypothetical protein M514_09359 [Trichuris suis]|uniref:Metalloendopeptidase n=1 Tax=Trichuris suis TaxID=68888 RepID=A0A085LXR8_9BILA|nr:hypothetical protein M513_09359 [Trichuris suis]KFD68509.1 hypothetical protein M514_09359 [Trichuris suis]